MTKATAETIRESLFAALEDRCDHPVPCRVEESTECICLGRVLSALPLTLDQLAALANGEAVFVPRSHLVGLQDHYKANPPQPDASKVNVADEGAWQRVLDRQLRQPTLSDPTGTAHTSPEEDK